MADQNKNKTQQSQREGTREPSRKNETTQISGSQEKRSDTSVRK